MSAICLYARYWSSRAKSRSRASSRARSASSSTSAAGSSRAAFRSSSVAATTRNSVVWSRSQSGPIARMYAMNSSVTLESATSVTSSLCLEISWRSRSKGPSKLASRTLKTPSSGSSGRSGAAGSTQARRGSGPGSGSRSRFAPAGTGASGASRGSPRRRHRRRDRSRRGASPPDPAPAHADDRRTPGPGAGASFEVMAHAGYRYRGRATVVRGCSRRRGTRDPRAPPRPPRARSARGRRRARARPRSTRRACSRSISSSAETYTVIFSSCRSRPLGRRAGGPSALAGRRRRLRRRPLPGGRTVLLVLAAPERSAVAPRLRDSPAPAWSASGGDMLVAGAVTALGGHRVRRVLRGGRGVALPGGSRHPGLTVGLAPGGGRLERHAPGGTEQFVGPRQTHSA